jgi:hypothetical protein
MPVTRARAIDLFTVSMFPKGHRVGAKLRNSGKYSHEIDIVKTERSLCTVYINILQVTVAVDGTRQQFFCPCNTVKIEVSFRKKKSFLYKIVFISSPY